MRKKTGVYILLIILILAFGVRLFGLDQPLYDDPQDYLQGIYNPHKFGLNPVVSQPPMISWVYESVEVVFGDELWKFRLTNVLFGIATLFVMYLLFLKIYGNRKGALVSVGIMAFSFYHILGSVQLGDEGSILSFFFVLFFYLYLLYKESGSKFCYCLVCIVFGLAMLTKISAVLIFGIAGLYELITNKGRGFFNKTWNTIKIFFPIGLVGLAIFSIFPLLVWLSESVLWYEFSTHMGRRVTFGFTLMGLSMFLFWATPFLWGLFPISAIGGGDKRNKLPVIWFLTVFLFYTFFVSDGDFSRYYMALIIPIALVCGNFLSKIKFRREHWFLCGIIFVFSYLLFNWLNRGVFGYVPRLMDIYLSKFLSFDWNFLFSYTSSSGPFFFLSFKSIMVAFTVSVMLILLFFVIRNKNTKKCCLIAFVAFAFAFNVVVAQEYLFHVHHPNPGETILDAAEFYKENSQSIKKPIYTNGNGLLFHMDRHHIQKDASRDSSEKIYYNLGVYGEYASRISNISKSKGGTIFLFDHPTLPRNSDFWKWANTCDLKKEFKSKGKTFVYVFGC